MTTLSKSMKFQKPNIIDDWLDKHGDPEIEKMIEKNLAIASKTRDTSEEKSVNQQVLAKKTKKDPSVV